MPFIRFLFSRSEPTLEEDLPVYTSPRCQQLPPYSRRSSHTKQLSTIPEVDEDAEIAEVDSRQADDAAAAAYRSSFNQRIRVPQALLVDASTTLCAYLYFSSLQARLVIQQQSAIEAVSSICSHIPLDADDSVLEYCARGIANLQDSVQQNSYVSHRSAILFTLFKALLGYLLLARVPSTIRPFDFLVVSGAVHCLALYCLFFVPVAAHFYHQPISSESIWLTICVKFVWILVFCFACVTLKQATAAWYRARQSRQSITLPAQACQVQIFIEDTDERSSVAQLVSAV